MDEKPEVAPGGAGVDPGRRQAHEGAPSGRKLLALMVIAVGIFAIGTVTRLVVKKRRLQEYLTARELVEERVQSLLYLPGVLKMAARLPDPPPGNIELGRCVLGGGECAATNPAAPVGFVARMGLEPDSPAFAGTEENPVMISGLGKYGCDPGADAVCPGWDVRAWFWVECPGGASVCAQPVKVFVRHQVRGVGELSGIPPQPPDEALAADPARYARVVIQGGAAAVQEGETKRDD